MSEPDELSVFQLCSLYIEVWDVNTLIVSEAVYSHAIVITPPSYRRVFPTISPAKMNGSKPKLAGRNYVTKGTHKKIWGPVPCVAPPRLFLSVYVSPVRLVPLEPKTAPGTIAVNVTWVKRGFSACQKHRTTYPSIFNRFPVIQALCLKVRHFS